MEQAIMPDFMVIDDDLTNNKICVKILQLTFPEATVTTFIDPVLGLDHISSKYSNVSERKLTLFLDINMPVMTGWEVLEQFSELPSQVKNKIKIFMLSSSICPEDIEKSSRYPLVSGFISKPLSFDKLKSILRINMP